MPIRDWAVSMKHCSVLSIRKMKCSRSVSEKTGSGLPIWQGYGQETMWRHSSGHIISGTAEPQDDAGRGGGTEEAVKQENKR